MHLCGLWPFFITKKKPYQTKTNVIKLINNKTHRHTSIYIKWTKKYSKRPSMNDEGNIKLIKHQLFFLNYLKSHEVELLFDYIKYWLFRESRNTKRNEQLLFFWFAVEMKQSRSIFIEFFFDSIALAMMSSYRTISAQLLAQFTLSWRIVVSQYTRYCLRQNSSNKYDDNRKQNKK